jgi:ribosomal protein L37AE/L43A
MDKINLENEKAIKRFSCPECKKIRVKSRASAAAAIGIGECICGKNFRKRSYDVINTLEEHLERLEYTHKELYESKSNQHRSLINLCIKCNKVSYEGSLKCCEDNMWIVEEIPSVVEKVSYGIDLLKLLIKFERNKPK